jgi:hypothetical protein
VGAAQHSVAVITQDSPDALTTRSDTGAAIVVVVNCEPPTDRGIFCALTDSTATTLRSQSLVKVSGCHVHTTKDVASSAVRTTELSINLTTVTSVKELIKLKPVTTTAALLFTSLI